MPLYSEDVLDRMGDKAIFTADLHAKGFALSKIISLLMCTFYINYRFLIARCCIYLLFFRYKLKVLPETFLIHHPHPISDNKYFYQHEKNFLW